MWTNLFHILLVTFWIELYLIVNKHFLIYLISLVEFIQFYLHVWKLFTFHRIKKYIYITEIYMRKQYKSSKLRIKNLQTNFLDGGSLKRLRSLLSYF